MLPSTVLQDIEQLPPAAQSQIIDFIEFLKTRYPASPSVTQPIEQTFGAIHVQKRVSLEQVYEVVNGG